MSVVILTKIFITIFGLLVGSFLNVVIYRLPRGESVVFPRSACPKCKNQLKWYHNIPVLSYLLLRGKCSYCNNKISIRYPLIELLSGIFAFLLAPEIINVYELTAFAFNFSLACIFLAHFVIDVEHQILPDKINIYFLIITLPFVIMNYPLGHWLIGGLIGFLGPFLITVAFYKLKGQVGLGGGDIKLYGILGLLFGPVGILNTIFLSCALGAVIGLILIALKKMDRNTPFAFGPFIIIVAAMQYFFPYLFSLLNFI